MKKYTVTENPENKKLKAYLMSEHGYSGRLIKRLLSEGAIRVDGKKGFGDSKVKPGALIEIEDFEKTEEAHVEPENLGLEILELQETFLAINKPAGMNMHMSTKITSGTVANGVAYIFKQHNISAPVRFLNRLDRDTSGIVIVPLSGFAHHALQSAYESGEKLYYAVVEGAPAENQGVINAPLIRDYENTGGVKVSSIGSEAITGYHVMERYKGFCLLELSLLTGRTHQIRAHMKHIGCPIVGDELYGKSSEWISRQALHAYKIAIEDPEDGLYIEIEAELPEDMLRLIEALRTNP